MFIKPTANAKNGSIFEIHPGAEDSLLYPKGDDVPTPWDADIFIEDGWVVIKGNMAPGGPGDKATCVCRLPIGRFTHYYELEIPEDDPGILEAAKEAGWEVAR